jgi:hypothetical protein
MDEFAELSKEEVIKRFASLEFNRFLDYYKNAPDLILRQMIVVIEVSVEKEENVVNAVQRSFNR